MPPKKGTYRKLYYSFWIGHPQSKMTEWILQDVKMPASCIREAIMLHSFSVTFRMFEYYNDWARKDFVYRPPDAAHVWMLYRRVIEYERLLTPERGYTVHQYKKIAEYSVYSYLNKFS